MARDLYGELDLNGNKIVGVAAGVNPTDAVNKSQLDAVGGAEMEVQVQLTEPTPVVGMDIWIDPDAPDWVGGGGGSGTPANAAPPAVTTASAIGISTDYAREDHTHAGATVAHAHVEGDLPSTLATDAEVSSAVSTHNSGSPHVALTANLPSALGAAAVGNGTTSARDNHVHPTTGLSLTGHGHVEGDLPGTLATDAEVTSAVSTHNSGSPHVALTANTPAALGVAAVGNGTASARDNHVHTMPTAANVGAAAASHTHLIADLPTTTAAPNAVSGAAGSGGSSTNLSKQDHIHRVDTGSPVALGAALADGVSNQIARADHVHIYPTAANVGAEASGAVATHAGSGHPALASTTPAALGSATVGVGTTTARADHVHAMPSAANVGAAATSHTHAAADVNSGTLAIGQVPTGTTGTTVALGNHTHTAPAHSALTGLANDDHTQYGIIVVSGTQPGSPRVGTIWVPSG